MKSCAVHMAVGVFWANSHFSNNPKGQSRGNLFPGCPGLTTPAVLAFPASHHTKNKNKGDDSTCGPCVFRIAKNKKIKGVDSPCGSCVFRFANKKERGSKPRGSYASFAWPCGFPLSNSGGDLVPSLPFGLGLASGSC